MQGRFPYELDYQPDGLTIHLSGGKAAALEMQRILVSTLGLKEKNNDYIKASDYDFHIKGSMNMLLVLEYLLDNKTSAFQLKSSLQPLQVCQATMSLSFAKTVATCLEGKNLSEDDAERISYLLFTHLNIFQDMLSNTDIVKQLKEKAVETDDLLHHPFFQTLSILMDDYINRKAAHNNPGLFNQSINEHRYIEVLNKYIPVIPDCYCDGIERLETKALNADKLRKSREFTPSNTLKIS